MNDIITGVDNNKNDIISILYDLIYNNIRGISGINTDDINIIRYLMLLFFIYKKGVHLII